MRLSVPVGSRLLAAEVMDRLGVEIVCEFAGLPWPLARSDWPHLLLIEVEGDDIELPDDVDAIVASDATDYERIWRYREHRSEAAALMRRTSWRSHSQVGYSIPLPRIADFVDELHPRT